jgi:hypothetical protein
MNIYKLYKLDGIITENKPGELFNIDINNILDNELSFNIKHTFYINNLNSNDYRGNHANLNAKEILICLSGTFNIKINNKCKEIELCINKNDMLYIDKNIWLELYNFKECVILAFVDFDETNKKVYNKLEYLNS